jgi:hypothetical protein
MLQNKVATPGLFAHIIGVGIADGAYKKME